MKKILSIALALALVTGFSTLSAEPSAEKILEECLAEMHANGIDIEDEENQDRLAEAIANEDEDEIKSACPKTFKKYD